MLLAIEGTCKISDFGLAMMQRPAVAARPTLTEEDAWSHTGGTPLYMSPEAALGARLTPASDVYSVGAILHELASGVAHLDLDGLTALEMRRFVITAPSRALPKSLPPALRSIVERALEKEPAKRYPTARAMRDDVVACLSDLGVASGTK